MRWRLADSPSAVSYYEQAMAGARFVFSEDVRYTTPPTLVIHGAEDRHVPPAPWLRPYPARSCGS